VPRRTHPLVLIAALAMGLLLAFGIAACGDSGSQSAETLEAPPLTAGTGATLPSTTASTSTTTTTTTTSPDTGGAADTGSGTGGAVDTGGGTTGDTGAGTGGDTGGGTAPATDGGTTTPTQPANPGGASPNYQSFCRENPGAC
jgi:hypothetical protein